MNSRFPLLPKKLLVMEGPPKMVRLDVVYSIGS